MRRQITALIGCALVALGVFAPAVTIPMAGAMNYLDLGRNGTPIGPITLVIAGGAAVAALLRWYASLWAAGAAILALEIWAYVQVDREIDSARAIASERDGTAAGEFASGLAELVAGSFRLQWAWPVLAAGGITLLIAAAMRSTRADGLFEPAVQPR